MHPSLHIPRSPGLDEAFRRSGRRMAWVGDSVRGLVAAWYDAGFEADTLRVGETG